ncbi:hypothetical protein P8A18_20185 [Streptomyces castrisilvae]|uniref:Uncharacterized protein n=1 Tax=Streptomyces castrisilvae TaxID=3033811 RepID=A0ABY9HMQ0_9ACTN|nr:hypothetical protein [Streptomyces sp. Mut1]WLQ35591.1 hypothetical protein P8A18_20170 [Streptomyces sp. Mut1]WLQ35594.1 hypothetical protein P8A18_20185 [Streptomyces sp. Mut1]
MLNTDALHTQHGHGSYLISRSAHYAAVIKKNHPGLSASSARTARPTSPPPSATPAATTTGPYTPSLT